MYQGRHCSYIDYELLERASSRYLMLLNNRDSGAFLTEQDNFISVINDFDYNLASKLKEELLLAKENNRWDLAINAVNKYINELKNNVLVDIREHQ